MIKQVEQRVQELIDLYTGPEFKMCNAAERGYHLVRALDEEVYNGLFNPWKPLVEYKCNSPDEILVTVTGFSPKSFSIHIRDNKDDSTDL